MSGRKRQPVVVGDLLGGVLRQVDPDDQLRAYRVWTFWDVELGELIARHAQPESFRDGTLFVIVDGHSWIQELRFMKDAIRDRLNARLGAPLVQDLRFTCGRITTRPLTEPSPIDPEVADAAVPLPAFDDPRLADAFARLLRARARRLSSKR